MKYPFCLLLICSLAMAQTTNPVTNGGFETLDAKGFPVDWEPVGLEVKLVPEAHSGKSAILLHRPANADERRHETGLNRIWRMDSGEQGKMLTVAKGGLRFWYKVRQADPDVVMKMNVIAMDKRPFEGCGVPRPFYQVPRQHFGDGQWHEGMLAFDFSENTRFEWLQVSPRITGPGDTEWLIDDLQWVESVGPLPHIISLKSYKRLDGSLQLRCLMTNSGDVPLTAGSVALSLPEPLRLDGSLAKQEVRKLAPDMFEVASWNIKGHPQPGSVPTARFTASGKTVEVTCSFGPALDWIQFQTERNVLWPGQEMNVGLVAYNRGDAVLPRIALNISLPPELELVGALPKALGNVPPWSRGKVQFRVRARQQTPAAVLRCQWQIPGGRNDEFRAEVAIGANPDIQNEDQPGVECESFAIRFPRSGFGHSIGWVYARTDPERLVGVIPNLGRLVTTATPKEGIPLVASKADMLDSGEAIGATNGNGIRFTIDPRILAQAGFPGPMYVDFLSANIKQGKGNQLVTCRITAPAPKEGMLLALDGPQLTTLEGGKDEALAPGMEWLVGDEDSSNDNVIGYNQTHRLRWRPHPHLVTVPLLSVRRKDVLTALFWHPRATWNDGTRRADLKPGDADTDRPTPVFATPDRFGGHACATMGLSVPSVGTYGERNRLGTGKGWPAAGVNATKIDFSYAYYVQTGSESALDALKAWFSVYGVAPPAKSPQAKSAPRLASPSPRFRGLGVPDWVQSAHTNHGGRQGLLPPKLWVDELEWSMQAYLDTLWDPETKEWRIFHGGPPVKHRNGAYPNFLFDCVTVAKLTDDPDLKRRLDARAKEVTDAHGGPVPAATDYGLLYGDPLEHIANKANQASVLLKSQAADGGWHYETRVEQGGVFKGRDYAGLSADGFEANGLVARKAWTLLRAHSMTGDRRLLDGGVKALAYMEKFRVPRAAQVWEVIGHAPDILAAADACQAYIEGYRATGDRKYLEKAKYWAWAGLPFVYQWGVDDYPWLRYGSIPIFGSTWWTCTWFGRPVQWNGLRYAYAIMELAEYDDSCRWWTVATGLTVSALHMQGMDPDNKENYALWPDVYNAVTGQRIEWNFAPRGFIIDIHKLMGREPYPVVMNLRDEKGKPTPIRVIGCARFVRGHDRYLAKHRTASILFEGGYPLSGRIVIAGVTEPQKVGALRKVTGNPSVPGTWSYDPETRAVVAFPMPDYKTELNIIGIDPVQPGFTPGEKTTVNFEFNATLDGWRRMHDIASLDVRGGMLHAEASGGDPYMVRSFCRINGDSISRIRVRLAASAGEGAQFFWTTEDSPNMAEDKQIDVESIADGEFHEIVFPVGEHANWRGKTITSIRIDPITGADQGKVRIDWIRGEE